MNRLSQLPLCKRLGVPHPIFGFSHSVEVTAAICLAGGVGIYGATRDMPEEIERKLSQIRKLVGHRPFGVDLLLPKGMEESADRASVAAKLPQEQKDFIAYLADKYQVPQATQDTFFSSQVRTNALFDAQIDAVMDSDVDLVCHRDRRTQGCCRAGQGPGQTNGFAGGFPQACCSGEGLGN